MLTTEHQNVECSIIFALMKTKMVGSNGLFKPIVATAIKPIAQGKW
jgi:hypothetical protein